MSTETKMPFNENEHSTIGLVLKITQQSLISISQTLGAAYGIKNKSYQGVLSILDQLESLFCHLERQSIKDLGPDCPMTLYFGPSEQNKNQNCRIKARFFLSKSEYLEKVWFHRKRGVFCRIINCRSDDGAALIVEECDSIGDVSDRLFYSEDDELEEGTKETWQAIYPNNGLNLTFEEAVK